MGIHLKGPGASGIQQRLARLCEHQPIRGLHTAITRMTIEGEPKGGWIPEQKISITDALKAYTQGGAFSSLEEKSKRKNSTRLLADFIVLLKISFH